MGWMVIFPPRGAKREGKEPEGHGRAGGGHFTERIVRLCQVEVIGRVKRMKRMFIHRPGEWW